MFEFSFLNIDQYTSLIRMKMNYYLWKVPKYLIQRQKLEIGHLFRKLDRSPAVTIYSGILWNIPLAMVTIYSNLYMVAMGVSDWKLGMTMTIVRFISLIGFLVGGYLSEIWGPKRTLMIFDIISWGSLVFFMAFALNAYWCIAAQLLFGLNSLGNSSYMCFLVEGTRPHTRPRIFALFQIFNILPSVFFLPLLAGYWVHKCGLIFAERDMFEMFLVFLVVALVVRWKFLPNVAPKMKSLNHWYENLKQALEKYRNSMHRFFKVKGTGSLLASKVIEEWVTSIWLIYSSLYLVQFLKIHDSTISALAEAGAWVSLATMILVVPYLNQKKIFSILGLDQFFSFLSFTFFGIGIYGESIWFSLIATILGAIASGLVYPLNFPVFMNLIEESDRAAVIALTTAFIQISMLIALPIGVFLYTRISPLVLIVVILLARGIGIALLRYSALQLRTRAAIA